MQNAMKRNSLLSLVSAPIIWAVHFLLCYVAVSLICSGGHTVEWVAGVGVTEAVIAGLTLAALALLGYIGISNYIKWRNTSQREETGNGMSRFFALCSAMLCGLSAVALVWVAFPTLILPSCAA